MIDLNDVDPNPARRTPPATRAKARARLIEIHDAIAAIRTQVGAADLKRQVSRTPIDPDWFHRAKTALRHLERERAELRAAMAALPSDRDRLARPAHPRRHPCPRADRAELRRADRPLARGPGWHLLRRPRPP